MAHCYLAAHAEAKMTYVLVLIFIFGSSLTVLPAGNKTYSNLEDCLAAAQAATRQELFSNNYISITVVGYCAPQ